MTNLEDKCVKFTGIKGFFKKAVLLATLTATSLGCAYNINFCGKTIIPAEKTRQESTTRKDATTTYTITTEKKSIETSYLALLLLAAGLTYDSNHQDKHHDNNKPAYGGSEIGGPGGK